MKHESNHAKVVTDTHLKGDTLYIIKDMKVNYKTLNDNDKCNDDFKILAYILYVLVLYLVATRYNN